MTGDRERNCSSVCGFLSRRSRASSGVFSACFTPLHSILSRSMGPDQSQAASTALLNCRLPPTSPSSCSTSAEVAASAARCPPEEKPEAAMKEGSSLY